MDQVLENILNRSRWAPSGDNTQCWRFEVLGARRFRVHGFDTREHCVYDLDGHPSQISMGALIETLRIAASAHGMRVEVLRETEAPESRPRFLVDLIADPAVVGSPLAAVIESRSVQRKPFSRQAMRPEQRAALQACLGDGFSVRWFEAGMRRRFAKLLFHSAKLRLITPEAYAVHRDVIEWDACTSVDRVPDQALGASAPTVAMMRFALRSWERVRFMNRFMAGTWLPRLELDVLPALCSAAHFAIVADQAPRTIDDYVAAGAAAQRFWLTATHLGLQLQPEITPLVFARYARESRPFSTEPSSMPLAQQIRQRLDLELGADTAVRTVFMGRVGFGAAARARSVRKPLSALMWPVDADSAPP